MVRIATAIMAVNVLLLVLHQIKMKKEIASQAFVLRMQIENIQKMEKELQKIIEGE